MSKETRRRISEGMSRLKLTGVLVDADRRSGFAVLRPIQIDCNDARAVEAVQVAWEDMLWKLRRFNGEELARELVAEAVKPPGVGSGG